MPVYKRDVTSLSKSGSAKLKGDITLSEGTNVTLAQSGNDIEITAAGGSGSGDVVGPASSTDNAIVLYDGTTGKLVQDSSVTIVGNKIATPGDIDGVGISTNAINEYNSGSGVTVDGVLIKDGAIAKSVVGLGNVDNTSDATKNAASVTLTNKTLSTGSTIDANVTVTEVLKKAYPVGCLYFSTNSTNPATSLGFGTWTAFGAGKIPVGFDSGDTDFDADEETGGAKTHTHVLSGNGWAYIAPVLGTGTMAKRKNVASWQATHTVTGTVASTSSSTTVASELGGATDSGSTMPPYITVRMWKRTA